MAAKQASVHTVQQGDTMIRIAHQYGFRKWETIWDHPDNEPLRSQRPDPQVLAAGDKVLIPEKEETAFEIETNQKHTFQVASLTAAFRLALKDYQGEKLANKDFKLEAGGKSYSGKTDQNSLIELDIDPDADSGHLTVWMGGDTDHKLEWEIDLGHLDPIDTETGLQQRLANLGYDVGPVDGEIGPRTTGAIKDFQAVQGKSATGEVDDALRQSLLEAHDER